MVIRGRPISKLNSRESTILGYILRFAEERADLIDHQAMDVHIRRDWDIMQGDSHFVTVGLSAIDPTIPAISIYLNDVPFGIGIVPRKRGAFHAVRQGVSMPEEHEQSVETTIAWLDSFLRDWIEKRFVVARTRRHGFCWEESVVRGGRRIMTSRYLAFS